MEVGSSFGVVFFKPPFYWTVIDNCKRCLIFSLCIMNWDLFVGRWNIFPNFLLNMTFDFLLTSYQLNDQPGIIGF